MEKLWTYVYEKKVRNLEVLIILKTRIYTFPHSITLYRLRRPQQEKVDEPDAIKLFITRKISTR